jgi:hypothetical protein
MKTDRQKPLWRGSVQHGDIEVVEDRAAGVWVGRHREYAVLSQGETELEAVEATTEAVEMMRVYCLKRGWDVPRWTTPSGVS